MEILDGSHHLRIIEMLSEKTWQISEAELRKHSKDLAIVGTSLSALYQAATCHRKCHGNPHIFEALTGRTYNLACSAYILIERGFYDEALNLLRSIGEIYNLLCLSIEDKVSFRKWLSADHKTRLKEFSPAMVRKLLEKQKMPLIYVQKDWYNSFCEKYTHVNPTTKPNLLLRREGVMRAVSFNRMGWPIH